MTRLSTAAVAVTLGALFHTRDCAGTSSSGPRAAVSPVAPAPPTAPPSPSPPPAPTAVPDLFAGAVRPILKGEDRAAFEQWLATLKPAS